MTERKHLKIEVGEVFGKKVLRIAEQTHRGLDFGREVRGFIASNGFELYSCDKPEAPKASPGLQLYVRGNEAGHDLDVVVVQSEEWLAKLRVTVREYNTTFSGEEKPGIEVIE